MNVLHGETHSESPEPAPRVLRGLSVELAPPITDLGTWNWSSPRLVPELFSLPGLCWNCPGMPTFLQQPLHCLRSFLPTQRKGILWALTAVGGTHAFSSLGSESDQLDTTLGTSERIKSNAQPLLYHSGATCSKREILGWAQSFHRYRNGSTEEKSTSNRTVDWRRLLIRAQEAETELYSRIQ